MSKMHGAARWAAAVAVLFLAACGSSDPVAVVPAGGGGDTTTAKTYTICPGPDAQSEAIIAFFDAHEGDTIEFCAGQFDFDVGLVMFGKKGITIKGAGKDQTYLRFKNSADQDGFNLNRMTGITVEGLTIYDAPGNGLRVFRSDYVTIRDVRVGWTISDPHADSVYGAGTYDSDPQTWSRNGAYAFYPVICHQVLIEDSISVGSSDAGVYVGQSSDILVRRTEAFHNVAGFEFENTYRAEFVDNYAHDNVGGFLVFDLPGRVQFGEKNLVHHNRSYNNNIPQFAPRGAIVAYVPSGTGALVLASDQLEFYDNDIRDNHTTGLVIVNYGLADANQSQKRYDFYPEGMHIYNNTFTNNGTQPQLPDPERSSCTGPGGLPGPGDDPACLADNAGLLVTIIQLKNLGKSAQIIWDGAVDSPNDCTEIPVDSDGIPLSQPNPHETRDQRYEARMDERGRPNLYQFDPEPACKYNAWKFDAQGELKRPQNGLCVENNTFNKTTPLALLVDDYANIHFATADPTAPGNLAPATHDIPTDCPTVEPALLPQFEPVIETYVPNPANDPRPSQAQLEAICGGGEAGKINYEALARFNCPRLDQYNLFADAQDPTQHPNGFGVRFELNSILFSDYASKYRFLFLPPDASGKPQKATFMDHEDCETINVYDCYTATLGFPVGTVIAKTFAFRDGDQQDVVETRLLIKRQNADGDPVWVGFAYEWMDGADGKRYARLKLDGSTHSVSWDYDDPDPEAVDAQGNRMHYSGATEHYAVPSAAACLLCHGGDDREAGTAPIGPKVRNLNRDYDYADVGTMNQLAYLQAKGYLDLPAPPEQLEKMVRWNVPGSGGDQPGSAVDVHRRVRAFLEVNCMHCHNPAGGAQNSGLRLDAFTEPMDQGHGICKPPIAAGRGADAGDYDIQPGDAGVSILVNRVASTEAGIKMPPTARSVMQTETVELLTDWIDHYVDGFAAPDDNTCGNSGGILPLQLMAPIPATPSQQAPWG
ncbi:MAG: right-handed parallel beta-helix repeat-containing protein [Nevskiales bacterium]|nr:right-handed parallel beta-helix repeat-containing protein [Nevskiales bacterium]